MGSAHLQHPGLPVGVGSLQGQLLLLLLLQLLLLLLLHMVQPLDVQARLGATSPWSAAVLAAGPTAGQPCDPVCPPRTGAADR